MFIALTHFKRVTNVVDTSLIIELLLHYEIVLVLAN
jgi:hypothetical protein